MISVIRQRGSSHQKLFTGIALAGAIVGVAGLATYAQSQSQTKSTGKATVIERRGPEVPLAANGAGQVVVLFPQTGEASGGGSGGAAADVEVVLVESQTPAAVEGQPAPTASTTGREILFSTRDANEGLVRHTLEANANARKLMVLARVAGKYVEARQTGGGEGVTVLTVQQPAPEPPPQAAAQDPNVAPAADAAQTGQAKGGQATQGQPAAASPAAPPAPSAQAAVIMIYTGSTSR